MRSYLAFTKKEIREQWKNYKAIILGIVFVIFGIMNPLIAKITPMLLENYAVQGIKLEIPDPVAMDSWMQFYKNIGQIGLIVVIILFSGVLTTEIQSGTLIPLVTKGLPRPAVIWSKFTMVSLYWSAAYFMSYGITYGYTAYFWDMKVVKHVFLGAFFLWLFGEMLLSIQLFFSTICKSGMMALLGTGSVIVLMFVIGIVPKAKCYLPLVLNGSNTDLLNGTVSLSDFYWPAAIAVLIIVVSMSLATILFNRRNL